MIPKRNRLPVQSIPPHPVRSLRFPYFTLKLFPRKNDERRIGVVVGKKVFAKATTRNSMRRYLYHFLFKKMSTATPYDVLLIAHGGAAHADRNELSRALDTAI